MKKLLFLLMLVPAFLFAQKTVVIEVQPIISVTKIDSLVTGTGSDTIKAFRDGKYLGDSASFVGARFYCIDSTGRFASFATVSSWIDSNTIVVSDTSVFDDSLATVQFGYFTSLAYSSGDIIGFPFRFLPVGNFQELLEVFVIDTSEQGANFDIVLFDSAFTVGEDNAAAAIPETDGPSVIGFIPVDGSYIDIGAVKLDREAAALYMPSPKGYFYGQLISRGTPTYTSISALTLKFIFKVQ